MSKTEAFCTQCGSLINIEDSKDKNKCLFCGTEVITANALDLKNDSEKRSVLQKDAEKKAVDDAKTKKERQKQIKGPKAEAVVAPTTKEIVVIKPLPLKTKLILFGILIASVLIISAILVPTILSRNEKREIFSSQLTQKIPFPLQSYSYKFNDNREFSLATSVDLTEKEALEAYQAYLGMYTKEYSITTEKAQKKIVLRVYAKNGLFLCKSSNGTITASFVTATPTPTTIPTTGIVSK